VHQRSRVLKERFPRLRCYLGIAYIVQHCGSEHHDSPIHDAKAKHHPVHFCERLSPWVFEVTSILISDTAEPFDDSSALKFNVSDVIRWVEFWESPL
jgi:hypothetical protein